MQKYLKKIVSSLLMAGLALMNTHAIASSHQDAPLITLDPSANTTDVYAFVTQPTTNLATYVVLSNIVVTNIVNGKHVVSTQSKHFIVTNFQQYLTVSLSVYPFEEPGSGPNIYRFDDNVVYVIYVTDTKNNLKTGRADLGYEFRFTTSYQTLNTTFQAFTGVITNVGDPNQNLLQTYTVTKVDFNNGKANTLLGAGIVPPNNQGISTPFYNQGGSGDNPVMSGALTPDQLDPYTAESIATNLILGYTAFAGQRDDGFFGDVTAIFDSLNIRDPGLDTQAGFNVHTIVLNIPLQELNGPQVVAGVYAATYRQQFPILRDGVKGPSFQPTGKHVQVARQGNPLFNELFVPLVNKNLYNRTSPTGDATYFAQFALNPELATALNNVFFNGELTDIASGRTDLKAIFIPDLIKVDLSTGPARLAGGPGVPDDPGFSRLGLFGGDTLVSTIQTNTDPTGTISGGWPNGRRFGDDVVDIALISLVSDLRVNPPVIRYASDNVPANDVPFNKVFPYAATPQNGRVHFHAR